MSDMHNPITQPAVRPTTQQVNQFDILPAKTSVEEDGLAVKPAFGKGTHLMGKGTTLKGMGKGMNKRFSG